MHDSRTVSNYLYRTQYGDLVLLDYHAGQKRWNCYIKGGKNSMLTWYRAGNQNWQKQQCRLGTLIGKNVRSIK